MVPNIRDQIVAQRRARIAALGYTEGADVPLRREVPIVPFLQDAGLICEVKRRSPSKGDIAPGLNAVDQARLYVNAGVRNLSVLTVSEGFGGSLDDMMQVKRAFPDAAVLRKDFLFDVQEVDVAWRAGADAVLLIAGMLDADQLKTLYRRAKELGLEALVEIHDQNDLRKAAAVAPNLVGINSRDLTTFRIDPLLPLRVKAGISWECRVIYESGISSPEQAAFAASAGFFGLLIGEAVVRDPSLAERFLNAYKSARPARFWSEIAHRQADRPGKTLVKICGFTREDDAKVAADLGADIIGFVFWPNSKRCTTPALPRALRDVDTLKIGVTVNPAGCHELNPEIRALLEEGLLDAVQLHGDEAPDDCFRLWSVNYKALKPSAPAELATAEKYHCPRILLDAFADLPGGSGKRVVSEIVEAWQRPLWLAGGITPDNAGRIVADCRPELIDVASGVEDAPGIKNADKMKALMKEIANGC